jgi:hypothetical protein
VQIVKDAEASGQLQAGGTIVEGSSGSTGISLAFVARGWLLLLLVVVDHHAAPAAICACWVHLRECRRESVMCGGAARGYKCRIFMPDDQAVEKSDLLRKIGADVERVPVVSISNPGHYVNRARQYARTTPGGASCTEIVELPCARTRGLHSSDLAAHGSTLATHALVLVLSNAKHWLCSILCGPVRDAVQLQVPLHGHRAGAVATVQWQVARVRHGCWHRRHDRRCVALLEGARREYQGRWTAACGTALPVSAVWNEGGRERGSEGARERGSEGGSVGERDFQCEWERACEFVTCWLRPGVPSRSTRLQPVPHGEARRLLRGAAAGGLLATTPVWHSAAVVRMVHAPLTPCRVARYDTIIEGVGLDRVTANVQAASIDDAFRVTDQEAVDMSRCVAHCSGIVSCGASPT